MCLPYFNPRSREGSDGFRQINLCRGNGFQSTLPRGERRIPDQCGTRSKSISIHAPARGATGGGTGSAPMFTISIHAPARGATGHAFKSAGIWLYFNPRSREGSDKSITTIRLKILDFNPRSREGSDYPSATDLLSGSISIHAPARGATEPECFFLRSLVNFNPRSREGSDRHLLRRILNP